MQKGTKWLIGLVAALVVINIALVAIIWLKKDEPTPGTTAPQGRGDARDYLVKTLSLTELQVRLFDSLRKGHFERINEYKKQIRFIKDRLFGMLNERDTNKINRELNVAFREKLGELQTEIDLETFIHFREFRSLLNEQQQEKFDNVIQDVLRTMGREGHPRNGPPGRDGLPPHQLPGGPPPHDGPPH